MSWPAPNRTSSKNSVNCFSGSDADTGSSFATSPGLSVGTRNSDSRPFPVASSVPVRATTISASASSTPEM